MLRSLSSADVAPVVRQLVGFLMVVARGGIEHFEETFSQLASNLKGTLLQLASSISCGSLEAVEFEQIG